MGVAITRKKITQTPANSPRSFFRDNQANWGVVKSAYNITDRALINPQGIVYGRHIDVKKSGKKWWNESSIGIPYYEGFLDQSPGAYLGANTRISTSVTTSNPGLIEMGPINSGDQILATTDSSNLGSTVKVYLPDPHQETHEVDTAHDFVINQLFALNYYAGSITGPNIGGIKTSLGTSDIVKLTLNPNLISGEPNIMTHWTGRLHTHWDKSRKPGGIVGGPPTAKAEIILANMPNSSSTYLINFNDFTMPDLRWKWWTWTPDTPDGFIAGSWTTPTFRIGGVEVDQETYEQNFLWDFYARSGNNPRHFPPYAFPYGGGSVGVRSYLLPTGNKWGGLTVTATSAGGSTTELGIPANGILKWEANGSSVLKITGRSKSNFRPRPYIPYHHERNPLYPFVSHLPRNQQFYMGYYPPGVWPGMGSRVGKDIIHISLLSSGPYGNDDIGSYTSVERECFYSATPHSNDNCD